MLGSWWHAGPCSQESIFRRTGCSISVCRSNKAIPCHLRFRVASARFHATCECSWQQRGSVPLACAHSNSAVPCRLFAPIATRSFFAPSNTDSCIVMAIASHRCRCQGQNAVSSCTEQVSCTNLRARRRFQTQAFSKLSEVGFMHGKTGAKEPPCTNESAKAQVRFLQHRARRRFLTFPGQSVALRMHGGCFRHVGAPLLVAGASLRRVCLRANCVAAGGWRTAAGRRCVVAAALFARVLRRGRWLAYRGRSPVRRACCRYAALASERFAAVGSKTPRRRKRAIHLLREFSLRDVQVWYGIARADKAAQAQRHCEFLLQAS